MSLSMYQASVPVFQRQLNNLTLILDKAAASAEARKIDPSVFPNARLAPDMFTLTRQIQIATDNVKGATARLAGLTPPKFEDNEVTIEDLKARIAKTLSFIGTVTAAQIDGSEERDITLKVGPRELQFKGRDYLLAFAMPNFYFHYSMTYAILRHNGVNLGKTDFLGSN